MFRDVFAITSYKDPGPYKNPPGTIAHKVATESE
jgi:hypothetical protein